MGKGISKQGILQVSCISLPCISCYLIVRLFVSILSASSPPFSSLAVIDGSYKILGRSSVDIIKSGGYKISALDIERELLEHPLIDEVAVVGMKDEQWGEIIAAIIVPKKKRDDNNNSNSEKIDLDSLRDWAKDRMASYKLPRRLLQLDSIPRNAMGKVNKKELGKLFQLPQEDNRKL